MASSGDGGDDGERIGGGYAGVFLVGKIADIVFVHVQVDKGAQLAFGGEEVGAELGMGAGEGAERLAGGGRFHLENMLSAGIGAEGSGDKNVHGEDASVRVRFQYLDQRFGTAIGPLGTCWIRNTRTSAKSMSTVSPGTTGA